MNFKDIVQHDIDRVFLDLDEFGSEAQVDGKRMKVIFDSYKLAEMKEKSQYAEELYLARMLLYCRPGDLGFRPAVDGFLNVNGKDYRVIQVTGEQIYRIVLGVVK